MTVKELIEKLNEQPQDAEVFYIGRDEGLYAVEGVKEAHAIEEEAKEVTGEQFVLLE